jgi:hypothetical protein
MREISDAFLLNVAEVSSGLIGLFLVGVFFYVESGFGRARPVREIFAPYLRAGTRITLIVFSFSVGLSLALVAMDLVWARVLFALLCLLLIGANIDSVLRIRGVARVTGSAALLVNEALTTALAVTLIIVPWALGGLNPSREDLTWAILLALAAGFMSIGATVVSAFDVARLEAKVGSDDEAG